MRFANCCGPERTQISASLQTAPYSRCTRSFSLELLNSSELSVRRGSWNVVFCLQAQHSSHENQEQQEGRVDLPDDQPEIVARMLHYLYTGEYYSTLTDEISGLLSSSFRNGTGSGTTATETDTKRVKMSLLEEEDAGELKVDILMYQCSDKLNVPGLKTAASASFRCHLKPFSKSSGMKGLADVVKLAYESTASGDTELRLYLTEQLVSFGRLVTADEALVHVIEKHEFIAWRVAQACQSRADRLAGELEDFKQKSKSRPKELSRVYERRSHCCQAHQNVGAENSSFLSSLYGEARDRNARGPAWLRDL